MKLIKIEDLEVGDEIVIACQAFFKYLKILKKPEKDAKSGWYKSVKCSGKRDVEKASYMNYKNDVIYYEKHSWKFTGDDHNVKQYLQLSGRDILLIKSQDYG